MRVTVTDWSANGEAVHRTLVEFDRETEVMVSSLTASVLRASPRQPHTVTLPCRLCRKTCVAEIESPEAWQQVVAGDRDGFAVCFDCVPPSPLPVVRTRPSWLRRLWEWLW